MKLNHKKMTAGLLAAVLLCSTATGVYARGGRGRFQDDRWSREKQEIPEPDLDAGIQDYVSDEILPTENWVKVPYISQKDIMPTGCEIVSAMMVLAYYEQNPTVQQVISHLDMEDVREDEKGQLVGPSPVDAFVGDPLKDTGYGCYPPVIASLMTELLPQDRTVEITTGKSLQELTEEYLNQEIPVLLWATIEMAESYPTDTWYVTDENGEPTKETFTWQANEHCMVLIGSDEGSYYFNDPWYSNGIVAYDKELVEQRFEELGRMSLAVY